MSRMQSEKLIGTYWFRPVDGTKILIDGIFSNGNISFKCLSGNVDGLNISLLNSFWSPSQEHFSEEEFQFVKNKILHNFPIATKLAKISNSKIGFNDEWSFEGLLLKIKKEHSSSYQEALNLASKRIY